MIKKQFAHLVDCAGTKSETDLNTNKHKRKHIHKEIHGLTFKRGATACCVQAKELLELTVKLETNSWCADLTIFSVIDDIARQEPQEEAFAVIELSKYANCICLFKEIQRVSLLFCMEIELSLNCLNE